MAPRAARSVRHAIAPATLALMWRGAASSPASAGSRNLRKAKAGTFGRTSVEAALEGRADADRGGAALTPGARATTAVELEPLSGEDETSSPPLVRTTEQLLLPCILSLLAVLSPFSIDVVAREGGTGAVPDHCASVKQDR